MKLFLIHQTYRRFSVILSYTQISNSARLFVKLPQPGDSEVIFSTSSQATICYYQSNYSKVEAIPLSALPKDTTSELAGMPAYLHTLHYPFNPERQARKL